MPITFVGRYTFADSLRATLFDLRSQAKKFAAMAVFCSALVLIMPLLNRDMPIAMGMFFYAIGFGFLTVVLTWVVLVTAAKAHRQAAATILTCAISAGGIDVTQANASSHLDWSFFHGYYLRGNLALLAMPDKRVLAIPRAAVDDRDRADLDALIDSRLPLLR